MEWSIKEKVSFWGLGKKAQPLRVLTEDLGSVPSTHMEACNHPKL